MKVTTTLYAKMDSWHLNYRTPAELADPEKLKGCLMFTSSPEGMKDYITMGQVEVEFEVITQNEMINGAIQALKEKQKQIRADATAACTKLESEIQKYLAIENKPS